MCNNRMSHKQMQSCKLQSRLTMVNGDECSVVSSESVMSECLIHFLTLLYCLLFVWHSSSTVIHVYLSRFSSHGHSYCQMHAVPTDAAWDFGGCGKCEPGKNDRINQDAIRGRGRLSGNHVLGGRAHGCHLTFTVEPAIEQVPESLTFRI